MLTETSSTWIDLNSELTFLKQSAEFFWLSSRDGYQHLYLYDYEGRCLRPITSGAWEVRTMHRVDEAIKISLALVKL